VDQTVIAAARWYYMAPNLNQYEAMEEINYKDQNALNALVSDNFGPWSNKVLVDQAMINP
jgi:hypothetical protein